MSLLIGTLMGLVLYGLFFLMAYLSRRDQTFTFEDMTGKRKGPRYLRGVPFVAHGGMWGDCFLLNLVLIAVMTVHGTQWSMNDWICAGIVGSILSGLVHWYWRNGPNEDCLAGKGWIDPAGWVHAVYTTLALTVIFLFYMATSTIHPRLLIAVSVILAIQVFLGTHLALSLLNFNWWRELNNRKDKTVWATNITIWIVLFWRTYVLLPAH